MLACVWYDLVLYVVAQSLMEGDQVEQLLHPAEVAELLGVSQTTLTRYRLDGQGPPAVYLSARTIRYRPQAVADWLDTKRKDKENDNDS